MENEEVQNEEVQVVNIEDFFTADNEDSGVWFEPRIKGNPCGIEFLVTGANTDKNAAQAERFKKERAKIEELKDPEERAKKLKEIDAKRGADFVIGIRPAKGCKINFDGQELTYSKPTIEKILLGAPLIRIEIINFAYETENFMKGKNNA